jgi:nucleoside triphosphate pyrophosphatase
MTEPGSPELVLASTSPFRRRMLDAAGLSFRVISPDVDEAALKQRLASAASGPLPPSVVADALARAKAEVVSAQIPEALVIGADQVLALGSELLSKPKDLSDARRQLERLRGKSHNLWTAVALASGGKSVWAHLEVAILVMHPFSDRLLERYLAEGGESLCRMVGAYQIEGRGIQLFERVDGDNFGIVGLPLLALLAELRARGVIES